MIMLYITIFALSLLVIWKLPKWQLKRYTEVNEKWKVENEFRRTIIQIIGGILIILSLYLTWKNIDQTKENFEKNQQADLFNKSIQLISANDYTQKVGGIYSLESLAKRTPEIYLHISIDLLSTLVRNSEYERKK